MAKTRYWGRFRISGKWSSLWHLITIRGEYPSSRTEAFGAFIKNTRYRPDEIQITTREPAKYAGKYPRR